jgi:hypothetical protein
VFEPGSVKSEPGPVKPEPGSVKPEPGTVKPGPGTVKPEPGTVKPGPEFGGPRQGPGGPGGRSPVLGFAGHPYRIRYSDLGYPSTNRAPSAVKTACSSRPMLTSTPPHSGTFPATENSMA